ncbi:MAG: protein phosphatase 2C domain-containing protein [Tannerella sp.]|jgi:protein phosphatase|nr:protein phosphatase 2C domain-containing protein [Tannerella sp.]
MSNTSLDYCCVSHIGKRPNHEDNFLLSNGRYILPAEQALLSPKECIRCADHSSAAMQIFAVSDGMGGHNAGETASLICVSKLAKTVENIQNCSHINDAVILCQRTISAINDEVCKISRANIETKDMGATLVLQIFCEDKISILNLGDSRAYFFDGMTLSQITKDNTEGQRMLDLNLLTEKEISSFPARKNVNRYIGYDRENFVLKADEYTFDKMQGIYLLCSDGLSDALSESGICEVLKRKQSIETTCKTLVECAASKQNADNITAILISTKE